MSEAAARATPADTVSYLNKLRQLDIPAPTVVGNGISQGYPYLLLTYLEGEEIGAAYQTLGAEEKRAIAREVVSIQRKAANMELEQAPDWKWENFVWGMLLRSESRILQNGTHFDLEKVKRLQAQMEPLGGLFFKNQANPLLR